MGFKIVLFSREPFALEMSPRGTCGHFPTINLMWTQVRACRRPSVHVGSVCLGLSLHNWERRRRQRQRARSRDPRQRWRNRVGKALGENTNRNGRSSALVPGIPGGTDWHPVVPRVLCPLWQHNGSISLPVLYPSATLSFSLSLSLSLFRSTLGINRHILTIAA